ncbi:MAG: GNAT family N-acetyltransferase [Rhodothermales bacterium]|nr:GNAT family N-acetyltransferase [Rhodothermales bacterium]
MADTETVQEDATLAFYPLTSDRWSDLLTLFGDNGACGGCWCMYWRSLRVTYEAGKGDTNRAAFEQLVREGPPPGVLAYSYGVPIGWCAVAPREQLTRLTQSFILHPLDDQPVWSVSCFFVTPGRRKSKVGMALLLAAVDFVKAQGGRIVEGYPVEARHTSMPPAFAWTGFASTFLAAGFTECARRSETRPMMRLTLPD